MHMIMVNILLYVIKKKRDTLLYIPNFEITRFFFIFRQNHDLEITYQFFFYLNCKKAMHSLLHIPPVFCTKRDTQHLV